MLLTAMNRGGYTPSYDVAMQGCSFDVPLHPNIPPTKAFIVSRLLDTLGVLLWDLLCDEVALQPMVGIRSTAQPPPPHLCIYVALCCNL